MTKEGRKEGKATDWQVRRGGGGGLGINVFRHRYDGRGERNDFWMDRSQGTAHFSSSNFLIMAAAPLFDGRASNHGNAVVFGSSSLGTTREGGSVVRGEGERRHLGVLSITGGCSANHNNCTNPPYTIRPAPGRAVRSAGGARLNGEAN